jgi:(p)ppGpp synthase/HD superfamily hydrolase
VNLKEKALVFAKRAHGEQVRKYTGEPYWKHPVVVARIVEGVPHDDAMVAAALLHDVVEDTPVTIEHIEGRFGGDVARLVSELTDVSKSTDGNRTNRKTIDREHSAAASARGQTIKVADLIDNSASITTHDPHFAVIYMREMRALLLLLTKADPTLLARAWEIVDEWDLSYAARS